MPSETAHRHWKDGLPIKLANIVVYFLFLGSNVYSVAGVHHVYRPKQTYITPANWTFGVWSLIHLLLLGFIFYQFTDAGKKVTIEGIGWRFAILGILNAAFVSLWAAGLYIPAFVVSFLVAAAVSQIYWIVKKRYHDHKIGNEAFVQVPFSLYHGWTLVLVILSGFEAFSVDAHKHKADVLTKALVFIALFFLEGTGAGYALYNTDGDLAGSSVITWTLWGIYDNQKNEFIRFSALGFAILSSIWVIKAAHALYKRNRHVHELVHSVTDPERAPLLRGH